MEQMKKDFDIEKDRPGGGYGELETTLNRVQEEAADDLSKTQRKGPRRWRDEEGLRHSDARQRRSEERAGGRDHGCGIDPDADGGRRDASRAAERWEAEGAHGDGARVGGAPGPG